MYPTTSHYEVSAATVTRRALSFARNGEHERGIHLLMDASNMDRATAADILGGRIVASCVGEHLYVVYPDAAPANALHVVFGS